MLETDRDREIEKRIATKVAGIWLCGWDNLGDYNPFDIYFHRGRKLLAIAEIKARQKTAFYDKECNMFDLDKYLHLFLAEMSLNLPGYFITAHIDGIYYTRIIDLAGKDMELKVMGRTDRGVKNDVCPCLEIPVDKFNYICDSEGIWEGL